MPSYLSQDEFAKLNEKERRLLIAQYAIDYGRGGITEMNRRYGVSRVTITKGIKELKDGATYNPSERTRREGAGRKRKNDTDYPELDQHILELAGNGNSKQRKSLRKIAAELKEKYGIQVSYMTVSRTLEKYK